MSSRRGYGIGMKLPLALVALILTAAFGHADFVIVQKVNGMAQNTEMTIKVSGDKVRADITPQISTITDAVSGQITTLMHGQKTYMVISADTTRAMVAQMTKTMQAQGGMSLSATASPPVASGKTDKINGYNASEYTFTNGPLKASYWMSTDFPNAKGVSDALAKFRKGGLADMTKAFAPDMSLLPGVPVKTEVEFNGQKIETELVSATEQAVDPGEFQVPGGYTEMKLPTGMPGQ
jgi:hypothetical protein